VDNAADLRESLLVNGRSVEWFKRLVVYRAHVDQPGFEWLCDL
jgi:hypothetical protein